MSIDPRTVKEELSKSLYLANNTKLVMREDISPELASAVAKLAFGEDYAYLGLNPFGQPIYGKGR